MANTKAQAWGFDLTIAIVIFLGAAMLFYFYIFNFSLERDEVLGQLSYEAKLIADNLLSNGFPQDWNSDNVVTIGILSDNKINETKLERFYNLILSDYQRTKILFNIKDDYYIYFNQPITIGGEQVSGIGQQEVFPKNLIKVTRVVIHESKIKNLNIHIWN